MATIMTQEGKDLIARLQAEGKPLIIDKMMLARIEGQDHSAPPVTTMPGNIVHIAEIPAEYRAYVNPSQVVYSVFLGSDVGDFSFNWQGLYCSEHGTIIAVATFPELNKRAYDAQTNTPGNNLTRNFHLDFDRAQEITGITIEAEVWQLDFTVRLKGIDERERLSNYDVYGNFAFLGDAWLLSGSGGVYSFAEGVGYVGGVRAGLFETLAVPRDSFPSDVWLDVSMPRVGSDVVTKAEPLFLGEGAWEGEYFTYQDPAPFKLPHYCAKIAHIDEFGNVTDLRKKYSVLPEEGEDGDVLTRKGNTWAAQPLPEIPEPEPPYWVGEWKEIHELAPPAGWKERNGQTLSNVREDYPELLAHLTAPENAWKCKTVAAWSALSTAAGGVGGVFFYCVDEAADTIKLPDTRGDYIRNAGYLGSAVGDWHTDAFQGHWHDGLIGNGSSGSNAWPGSDDGGVVNPANVFIRNARTGSHGAARIATETRTRAGMLLGVVFVGGKKDG